MILDKTNRKLLYELEKNSKLPAITLAKRIKVSKEVVSYRINRLQKEGILRSCTAIVDIAKLGYLTFRIYIKWQNIDLEEKKAFYEQIGKKKNVWTTTELHGKWDFAIFLGIKRDEYIDKFHTIWDEIQSSYKNKIAETKIAIYAPIYNFNKRFFVDEKEVLAKEVLTRVSGEGKVIDHDELDEKIVLAFSPDVRQSLQNVAEQIGTSIETVRRRIKELEDKKVIVGYKIDLDLGKLNYQGYRVDFALNKMDRYNELFEYLKQHKYFYQINKSIGGADFETEIVVKDLPHLLLILEEIMTKFKGIVKNYEYMGYTTFPKLSIVPD
jgi:DNA-binding Lrp family transcriptional regulator